jgi:hypothetical protein
MPAAAMIRRDMGDKKESDPWIIVCEAVDDCCPCDLIVLSIESIALDGDEQRRVDGGVCNALL